MASRKRKVIILGSTGFHGSTADLQVNCYPWSQLAKVRNIRDYDVVILNLLPLSSQDNRDQVKWAKFHSLLDFGCTLDILRNNGAIFVVGDPRFQVPLTASSPRNGIDVAAEANGTYPFLRWSGLKFVWDSHPGDTVITSFDYESEKFSDYIARLAEWSYSLLWCKLDLEVIGEILKSSAAEQFDLRKEVFCHNRYNNALAFTAYLSFKQREFGPITFLPKTSLNEDETIQTVLSSIGIEADLPEPNWLSEYMAPGQDRIDDDIARIKTDITALNDALEIADSERASCRECLKLLYEKEHALEPVVRDILRALGADVEDPKEKGREDGWLVVKVGDETYEGVLEIKSTRRDQFDESGRKQLLDWIDRGRTQRHKNYKGIFIGNSAIDQQIGERPDAFSDNWKKAAELSDICALKTEHLYAFYVLQCNGEIEMDEIWTIVFESNGVLNFDKYLVQLNG